MSREISETQSLVEEVAGAIMALEPDDLAELAPVQQALEQIKDHLQDSRPVTSRLAGTLALAAEEMRSGQEDASESLDTLINGVAALQSMCTAYERNQQETVSAPEVIEAVARLAQVDPEMFADRGAGDAAIAPTPDVELEAEDEAEMERVEEDPSAAQEGDGTTPQSEGENQSEEIAADDPETGPVAVDGLTSSLEQIARDILVVDLDDLSKLGKIHLQLEEIGQLLEKEQTAAGELNRSLAGVIEKIIFEEYGDLEIALTTVIDGVAMLRDLHSAFVVEGAERIDDGELLQRVVALAGSVEDEEAETATLSPEAMMAMTDTSTDDGMEELLPDAEAEPAGEAEQSGAPVEVDGDIFLDFSSEADEHLSAAESTLLALETNPTDAELLNTLFRSFHTIKGAAGFLNLEDITRVAHVIEDVLDSARKGQLILTPAITDVILASIDLLKELLGKVEKQLEAGAVVPQDVSAFLARVRAAGKGEAPNLAAEVSQPTAPADGATAEPKRREQQHVRVDTEKLDQLVNVVGELVIAQTQVGQSPDVVGSSNQKLSKDISQLMKTSGDLQEIAMALRMVPIRATFERMARMVRDLGRKCGKQVEFNMRGEDTELDKNVVEEIVDPLTHMVRNSMDHGVESAEERRAAGKPEKGQVVLEACHKSGHVVIELSDDGKGIDRDKVFKKAVERGLVSAESELSDAEVFNLIFHPGLSTADKITDVSGRGVGMDVVRRNIEQLRGRVEVHSELGKGSVFTIKLPLTLAIIDGMVIGVGEERYILPLTSIISSLRPQPEQISTVLKKGEMVRVQDELFPLVRLHERFEVKPRHTDPCSALVALIEAEGNRCCLMVDELVGLQQVVIKGLDEELRQDPCLAGCAILGDGRVGLILDANGLVENAHGKNKGAWEKTYQQAS